MSNQSDTIQDWLISNRLYEDNLFYYALIIVFWFFVGFTFLGFEIGGFSQAQNLFFNFLWYVFICTMMALCPFWFKLFFAKTHTAKREQELIQALDELDEYDRAEVEAELVHTGHLAMRPVQRWALVFLGSYFLFEVFFISAWVKDMALVWKPDWVMRAVEWVRANTNLPPLNVDRKIFSLSFQESTSSLTHELRQHFSNEQELINSPFAITLLFYHFIRFMMFVPILASLSIIFWQPLKWMGVANIDPRYINNLSSFIRACAWSIVMGFFVILFTYFIIHPVDLFSSFLINPSKWFIGVQYNILFMPIVMGLRFFYGWFVFFGNKLFYLINM